MGYLGRSEMESTTRNKNGAPLFQFKFAKAKIPTPILNTPHFHSVFGGEDGSSLPLDEQGLLKAVETIALIDTKFQLIKQCTKNVFQVKTQAYPGDSLFVDGRFLAQAKSNAHERKFHIPSSKTVIDRLKKLEGTAYIWGGNWLGIPELLEFYPPKKPLHDPLLTKWTLNGVDCSGLLYLTTDGAVPRNTSQLVNFGKSLSIQGKTCIEIKNTLRPLDLIVWKGHVLIALDQDTLIESRGDKGVVIFDTIFRLAEIIESLNRIPVDNWDTTEKIGLRFVARRWHPGN
jgi:cell wall-associated NlpC family hydrolase